MDIVFVFARGGLCALLDQQAHARAMESLVQAKMRHKEFIILCLEDCSDWSNATTRRVVMQVNCGTAVFLKPEFYSCSKLNSLNFGVGLTYKIFISNLGNITAYFCDCSQHADFEILTI
ncbi:hypothetical protein S83_006956 [Arachis hypogaea]